MTTNGFVPVRSVSVRWTGLHCTQVADVPKETEFEGLSNLVEAVSRYSNVKGKTLYACLPSFQDGWRQWGALDDVVRGWDEVLKM